MSRMLVYLNEEEREALSKQAILNFRDMRNEARYLIRQGLGLIKPVTAAELQALSEKRRQEREESEN